MRTISYKLNVLKQSQSSPLAMRVSSANLSLHHSQGPHLCPAPHYPVKNSKFSRMRLHYHSRTLLKLVHLLLSLLFIFCWVMGV